MDSHASVVLNKVRTESSSDPRRVTEHDETVVAEKKAGFSLPSYSGPTEVRSIMNTNGTGAEVVNATTGEIRISSGTDGAGEASIRTKRRGVYQPGSMSEVGLGVRLDAIPVGSQDAKWGYFDSQNGIGWGIDSQDMYVFLRRQGTIERKVYRSDWEWDPLDGTGPSGASLDPLEGAIYQMEFVWYGFGPVAWQILKHSTERGYVNPERNRVVADSYRVREDSYRGTSINQPNQPIRVEVSNNGTADSLDVFVGGRQYGVYGGANKIPTRLPSQELYQYNATPGQGNWEPLLAIRKRETFRGYPNPINVFTRSLEYRSDQDATFRLTINNSVDDGATDWTVPPEWGTNETSVELASADGNISVADDGLTVGPLQYASPGEGGRFTQIRAEAAGQNIRVPIENGYPLVAWVRQDSSTGPTVDLNLGWEEWF